MTDITSKKSISSWLRDCTISQSQYIFGFPIELNIFNNHGSKWFVCNKLTGYIPELLSAVTHFISVHFLYFSSISSESLMP